MSVPVVSDVLLLAWFLAAGILVVVGLAASWGAAWWARGKQARRQEVWDGIERRRAARTPELALPVLTIFHECSDCGCHLGTSTQVAEVGGRTTDRRVQCAPCAALDAARFEC